jgi:hypothetical protein
MQLRFINSKWSRGKQMGISNVNVFENLITLPHVCPMFAHKCSGNKPFLATCIKKFVLQESIFTSFFPRTQQMSSLHENLQKCRCDEHLQCKKSDFFFLQIYFSPRAYAPGGQKAILKTFFFLFTKCRKMEKNKVVCQSEY